MSQWKSTANVAGMPKWAAEVLRQGAGPANVASNNAALIVNTTPGAIVSAGADQNRVVGVWPVTVWNKANTTGESAKVHGLGWAMRYAGEGPIVTFGFANGYGFANGETVVISGGSVNATANLTANATGNLASGTIVTNGAFPNVSVLSAAFIREFHVANLNFVNSTSLTGVGNSNTINVVIGNTHISYGKNAVAQITSNSTGGITNSITQAITWTGNSAATNFWGLFANNQTNTAVTVTFTNANGTVIGGTYTATANLVTSTGGALKAGTTLGGRANRVSYEMLVIDRNIANGTTSKANTVQLPQ